MYSDKPKTGPTWTCWVGVCANCVSPTISSVLACSSLEGDVPAGNELERLSPEAVMASCRRGISLSMRFRRSSISDMISSVSNLFLPDEVFDLEAGADIFSWAEAMISMRWPRATISRRSDLVKGTAESRKTLPRPDLRESEKGHSDQRKPRLEPTEILRGR